MKHNRFMRLILLFDLPTKTKEDLKEYRQFIKYLKNEGFFMVQYSVYSKLCINIEVAQLLAKRLEQNVTKHGDVRYLIITERQYQNIKNVNNIYSLQEKITTTQRTLIIGDMNDENTQG